MVSSVIPRVDIVVAFTTNDGTAFARAFGCEACEVWGLEFSLVEVLRFGLMPKSIRCVFAVLLPSRHDTADTDRLVST